MMVKSISLRVPDDVYAAAVARADQDGRSLASWVGIAVRVALGLTCSSITGIDTAYAGSDRSVVKTPDEVAMSRDTGVPSKPVWHVNTAPFGSLLKGQK